MSTLLARVLGGFLVLSAVTVASGSSADDSSPLQKGAYTTLSITSVKWSVASGGVGTFSVIVSNTATAKTSVTGWASATSAGATTLRTDLGTIVPGQTQTLRLAATSNGRCYVVALALDPDAGGNGIRWDGRSHQVCLDPDGGGIVPSK